MRTCHACGSDKVVQYHRRNRGHGIVGWYTNYPTDLVLCNSCNNHLLKRHKHKSLTLPGEPDYWALHEWVRKNRPKPLLCEQCNTNPPREVACIGEYKQDISHFRWICVSCHAKLHGRGYYSGPRRKRFSINKGKMRKDKQLIKRTFWLTPETDQALRIIVIKDNKKFSVIAEDAFQKYIKLRKHDD